MSLYCRNRQNNFIRMCLLTFLFILPLTTSWKELPNRVREDLKRKSGILLHITSLPSNYGIGTLGDEAYRFIDFLSRSNQKLWQMLPINPTSFGNSPFQPVSSFAGNPYLIDLDLLVEDLLLEWDEIENENWGKDQEHVDYSALFRSRYKVLKKAYNRFKLKRQQKDEWDKGEMEWKKKQGIPYSLYDYEENDPWRKFLKDNRNWLDDYALFMACKEHFDQKPWTEWPTDIKNHRKWIVEIYHAKLKDKVNFHKFLQFKFYQQFRELKQDANYYGIEIIGEIPFYMEHDSADVWANTENFQLDENGMPLYVAGVPPDLSSEKGQLWGNTLYNWEALEKSDFAWWIKRFKLASTRFDIIKINHFRGIDSYWSIPYGDKTAERGKWEKGPGKIFIDAIKANLPKIKFIAEDIGYLSEEGLSLLEYSNFPGMRVLEYSFDTRTPPTILPYEFIQNSACYTGTHDDIPLKGWQKNLTEKDRRHAEKYFDLKKGEDLRMPMIRAGMASTCDSFIVPMQDYLNLGEESRVNKPGTSNGENWSWRMKIDEPYERLEEELEDMTETYSRT